jgi:hypothetical protein
MTATEVAGAVIAGIAIFEPFSNPDASKDIVIASVPFAHPKKESTSKNFESLFSSAFTSLPFINCFESIKVLIAEPALENDSLNLGDGSLKNNII